MRQSTEICAILKFLQLKSCVKILLLKQISTFSVMNKMHVQLGFSPLGQ